MCYKRTYSIHVSMVTESKGKKNDVRCYFEGEGCELVCWEERERDYVAHICSSNLKLLDQNDMVW